MRDRLWDQTFVLQCPILSTLGYDRTHATLEPKSLFETPGVLIIYQVLAFLLFIQHHHHLYRKEKSHTKVYANI